MTRRARGAERPIEPTRRRGTDEARPRPDPEQRRPRTVAILAADGVEQVEVTAPRDALAAAGCDVRVLSPDGKSVRGYHYIDAEDELPVDGALGETRPDDVDVVLVPGGLGSPDTLRTDRQAVALVSAVARAGKPIGVICHGPWVLLEAGVLDGRTLTCVPALRTDVANGGATYVDETVHVDRTQAPWIVSGRNFEAADAFARTLVQLLADAPPPE